MTTIKRKSTTNSNPIVKEKERRIRRFQRQYCNNSNEILLSHLYDFSPAIRDKNIPGYVCLSTDPDGVVLRMYFEVEQTEIFIDFDGKRYAVPEDLVDSVINALVSPALMKDIQNWLEIKKDIRSINSASINSNSAFYRRKNEKGSRCIYCNKSISVGQIVCLDCSTMHSKQRRGIGGYPSYDPNATGNNGNI